MRCKNEMVSSLAMMGGIIVTELHYQLVIGKLQVALPPDWTRRVPPELMMMFVKMVDAGRQTWH